MSAEEEEVGSPLPRVAALHAKSSSIISSPAKIAAARARVHDQKLPGEEEIVEPPRPTHKVPVVPRCATIPDKKKAEAEAKAALAAAEAAKPRKRTVPLVPRCATVTPKKEPEKSEEKPRKPTVPLVPRCAQVKPKQSPKSEEKEKKVNGKENQKAPVVPRCATVDTASFKTMKETTLAPKKQREAKLKREQEERARRKKEGFKPTTFVEKLPRVAAIESPVQKRERLHKEALAKREAEIAEEQRLKEEALQRKVKEIRGDATEGSPRVVQLAEQLAKDLKVQKEEEAALKKKEEEARKVAEEKRSRYLQALRDGVVPISPVYHRLNGKVTQSMQAHLEVNREQRDRRRKSAPQLSAKTPKKSPSRTEYRPSPVFDKLTDSRLYTGSHRERFDHEGRGKGFDGRDRVKVPFADFRKEVHAPSATPHRDIPITEAKYEPAPIFDKLTDTRKYTGTHKKRFDSTGRGRGSSGRDIPRAPHSEFRKDIHSPSKAERKDSALVESKYEPAPIFDKLTDPKNFTGAHKKRFGPDGRGLGLEGVDRPKEPFLATLGKERRKTIDPAELSTSATTPLQTAQYEPAPIFDRLTDPTQYTGAAKQLFSEKAAVEEKLQEEESEFAQGAQPLSAYIDESNETPLEF